MGYISLVVAQANIVNVTGAQDVRHACRGRTEGRKKRGRERKESGFGIKQQSSGKVDGERDMFIESIMACISQKCGHGEQSLAPPL